MNIEDSGDIRFRYVPILKWFCGALFLFVCIAIIVIGYISGEFSLWFLVLFFAIVPLIDLNNSTFIFAPLTTVDLCRKSKYVQISYTRIYGKRVNRYYFSQVEKFKSYKAKLNFS
jgi:hypothetical protein